MENPSKTTLDIDALIAARDKAASVYDKAASVYGHALRDVEPLRIAAVETAKAYFVADRNVEILRAVDAKYLAAHPRDEEA